MTFGLAITGIHYYSDPPARCVLLNSIHSTNMAAKKTTASTTRPASRKATEEVVSGVTKPAKKAAKKAAKTVAQAVVVPAAAKKTALKKAAITKAAVKITPDEIARAAYLNYRRRVEQGLPGDSRGDWLEAERILGKPGKS